MLTCKTEAEASSDERICVITEILAEKYFAYSTRRKLFRRNHYLNICKNSFIDLGEIESDLKPFRSTTRFFLNQRYIISYVDCSISYLCSCLIKIKCQARLPYHYPGEIVRGTRTYFRIPRVC